jgi:predicted ATPase
LAQAAPLIMDSLSRWLSRFTSSIHYARPVREAPVRLHQLRDQAVDQLDPTGANLAMFLMKLDPPNQSVRLDEFSRWAQELLGFRVHVHDEGQWHVEVQIEEDGRSFNLVDMGYGYSQLLPVLLQCWSSMTGHAPDPQRPPPSFLAIEQPELHLHPAHQARLADVFVAASQAVSQAGGRLRFLIETHSDVLINRLGELIESARCSPDEVSVLLFERDPVTGDTTVRVSEFDERGYLKDWPVGFFSP